MGLTVLVVFFGSMQYFKKKKIPEIENEDTVHGKTSVQEKNFRFSCNCWRRVFFLFFHFQLMGTDIRLPKKHRIHTELDLVLKRNLSPGMDRIDNAVPYFPHDKVVCDPPCDACKKSHELNVCRKLLSIW